MSPINGIRFQLTPGHSPGHSVIEFKKQKSRLVVTGDLWHVQVCFLFQMMYLVSLKNIFLSLILTYFFLQNGPTQEFQIKNPDINLNFDYDRKKTRNSRRQKLRELSRSRNLVLAYHEGFPGLGYIRKRKPFGFQWVPVSINDLQGDFSPCS